MTDTDKTCGSCVNCEKYTRDNGERWWVCENYVKSVGMPVTVTPPGDTACENWSDDPADKDKPQDALRYFVDHYRRRAKAVKKFVDSDVILNRLSGDLPYKASVKRVLALG